MKLIPRDIYLNRLISRRGSDFIKIITGIRRCGKSYLLDPIFHNYLIEDGVPEDHIIHLNLELDENAKLRNPATLREYVEAKVVDDNQYYLLLDEIQLIPNFEGVLSGFLYKRNIDTYVTGSNSRFLSSDVATEFRGRGEDIHMYPLSFAEFVTAKEVLNEKDTHHDSLDLLTLWEEYYQYGGLPQVLSYNSSAEKMSFLKTQCDNVYLNDIIERYRLRKSEGIGTLTEIVASVIGSLTNPHKLERTFKSIANVDLSYHKIADYLEILENAFLIERSRRFDVKGKRYIDTPAKYYFSDCGIRNSFIEFRQMEETHLMENILYNELRRRGYYVDVGVVETREGDARKNLEVDFVANLGDRTYYIQSALRIDDIEKYQQETKSLNNIGDNFSKIIITKDIGTNGHDRDGIVTIGLFKFLTDENILDNYQ